MKKRGFVDQPLGLDQTLRKSPFVEGFKTGLQAAFVAGPVSATYALLKRSKNPALSGILGAAGAGLGFGLLGAAKQDLQNKMKEAELRWHLRNVKERSPYEFLPPEERMAHLMALARQREQADSSGVY